MSEYSDITLVECNRGQSIEAQSNNQEKPGQFTCRLGEALDLQAGDQINVENAFVSSLGCGGQNIQFKGDPLLDKNGNQITQDFEVTELDIKYDPSIQTLGHRYHIKAENKTITKKLQDNKTYFTQQYYKNNNGENMMYLPRRFSERLTTIVPSTDPNQETQLSNFVPAVDFSEDKEDPTTNKGKGKYTLFNRSDTAYTGKSEALPTKDVFTFEGVDITEEYKVCKSDYFYYLDEDDPSIQYTDGLGYQGAPYFKPKTDNKRFTLFIRDETLKEGAGRITILDYAKNNFGFNPILAPYHLYTELKELTLPIGYNSPEAIEQSLTEQIQSTRTFNFVGPNANETHEIKQPESFEINGQNVITTTTTETYMPIECGGFKHNDYENWRAIQRYINDPTTTTDTKEQAIKWWNSHQYLMVKRPELFIIGRKLNDWSGRLYDSGEFNFISQDITYPPSTEKPLVLNMNWTGPNLKLLRDLFKAQEKYMKELAKPYLVINEPPENQRFLHVNSYSDAVNDLGVPDNFLGNDGYYTYSVATGTWLNDKWHTSSMPIFFKYDKSQENNSDVVLDSEGITTTTKLTYGCFAKTGGVNIEPTDKICLYPGLIGSAGLTGWKPEIFCENSILDSGTYKIRAVDKVRIGWDWHANSYGNVIMTGINGLGSTIPHSTIATKWEWDTAANKPKEQIEYIKHISLYGQYTDTNDYLRNPINLNNFDYQEFMNMFYIGANNPTIFFDNISQHFGIKNLHTAEITGEEVNAGSLMYGTGTTEKPAQTIPSNDSGGQVCYKINKRLNYVDFSPDMKPYHYKIEAQLYGDSTGVDSNQAVPPYNHNADGVQVHQQEISETIYPSNKNIEVGAVFDSQSGVYWDIGGTCPKEYFDKSFWGILGFTYEQYNPTEITSNNGRQARIGTDNMFNLELATTNCQVVSTDLQQYPMNIWGYNKYSCQLAAPILAQWKPQGSTWIDESTPGWKTYPDPPLAFNFHPPIVEETQSIELRAEKLPKLMSRPYYTIRSDIIDVSKYIGGPKGGNRMPIVAICDKLNGNKDYFFTDAAGLAFTITKPISLSTITISIHDPDGTDAVVDNNSSVIFRISKNKNTSRFKILDQILQQQQQKK